METSTKSNANESSILEVDLERQPTNIEEVDQLIDYSSKAQWLRAAILGANDGLLSTASLMMGAGAVRKDVRTMVLTGIIGLVAGACSMGVGEYVSVYSQYNIELAQLKREGIKGTRVISESQMEKRKGKLPSPFRAAAASALSFAVGALLPLLAAGFVYDYGVRLGVVAAVVSVALIGFGWLSAVLGRAPVVKPLVRVLIGGWLAMGITYGLIRWIASFEI